MKVACWWLKVRLGVNDNAVGLTSMLHFDAVCILVDNSSLDITMTCAKAAEPIKLLFRVWTQWARGTIITWGSDPLPSGRGS